MAHATIFKVSRQGEYVASFKYIEDAIAFTVVEGDTIHHGRRNKIVWSEGKELCRATDSPVNAALIIERRVKGNYGGFLRSSIGEEI